MGNVPLTKLVGKGRENKLTKFQRQKLKYDFDTFFGKYLYLEKFHLHLEISTKITPPMTLVPFRILLYRQILHPML